MLYYSVLFLLVIPHAGIRDVFYRFGYVLHQKEKLIAVGQAIAAVPFCISLFCNVFQRTDCSVFKTSDGEQ